MSERVQNCETFLRECINNPASFRKQLLTNCTEEELAAIVECIVNVRNLKLDRKEKQCIAKCSLIRKYFYRKRKLRIKQLKKFLCKNHKQVATLLTCVLTKIVESALVCLLSKK